MLRLKKLVRRIVLTGNWIGMSMLILMMLLIVSNIIIRFFGSVITPTYEISELLTAIGVSFCIVLVTMEKSNIVVDLVLKRLPARVQQLFQIINLALGLVTWAMLGIASIIFANKQWRLGEKTDLLDIPITPIRYIWVIALIILCFLILLQLWETISKVGKKWIRS